MLLAPFLSLADGSKDDYVSQVIYYIHFTSPVHAC